MLRTMDQIWNSEMLQFSQIDLLSIESQVPHIFIERFSQPYDLGCLIWNEHLQEPELIIWIVGRKSVD